MDATADIRKELLVDPDDEPIGSLDALAARCLPDLTSRLWETCCWPDTFGDWHIGDYRFLVVEFFPSEEASLYVQFWSEPFEPVLMEVSSGHWNPGALKYVWHEQQKALEERGFVIGGRARNFQKEVFIRTPEEAERAAAETLAIVFELFGFRGLQPLVVKTHRGQRGEEALTHESLTPQEFIKLAQQAGFHAERVADEQGGPTILLEKGHFTSVAILRSHVPKTNLFASVALQAVLREPSPHPVERISSDIDVDVPLKLIEGADGRVLVETSIVFDGGVTAAWIIASLERWRIGARKFRRLVLKSAKQSAVDARFRGQRVTLQ